MFKGLIHQLERKLFKVKIQPDLVDFENSQQNSFLFKTFKKFDFTQSARERRKVWACGWSPLFSQNR